MIISLFAVLGLASCQQEGPAEKTGKKLDRSIENAEQKIEQGAEKAENKLDDIKESITEKTETSGQYIDDSVENAEQKIEQGTEKAESKLEDVKESIIEKTEASGQYIDDSVITLKIKTAILNEPSLKVSQIKVTTADGVVQLSGTVDSQQSIDKAIEIAQSQDGVKSVQSDLTVNTTGD